MHKILPTRQTDWRQEILKVLNVQTLIFIYPRTSLSDINEFLCCVATLIELPNNSAQCNLHDIIRLFMKSRSLNKSSSSPKPKCLNKKLVRSWMFTWSGALLNSRLLQPCYKFRNPLPVSISQNDCTPGERRTYIKNTSLSPKLYTQLIQLGCVLACEWTHSSVSIKALQIFTC